MSINLKDINIRMIVIAVICLGTAYTAEYIFLLAPCPLCIYQRYPYFVFILLGIIGLATHINVRRYYFAVAIIAVMIASYHAGVERGIFELSALCKPSIAIGDNMSVEGFKNMLYSNSAASCDKATLIMGMSMAEWNLLMNVGIIIMLFMPRKNLRAARNA